MAFDYALEKFDVLDSLAHCEMLQFIGLLSSDEWNTIEKDLKRILSEIEQTQFVIESGIEDVQIKQVLKRCKAFGLFKK